MPQKATLGFAERVFSDSRNLADQGPKGSGSQSVQNVARHIKTSLEASNYESSRLQKNLSRNPGLNPESQQRTEE